MLPYSRQRDIGANEDSPRRYLKALRCAQLGPLSTLVNTASNNVSCSTRIKNLTRESTVETGVMELDAKR